MAQSQLDYIKTKRIITELKEQTKFPPVLSSKSYTEYSGYSIVRSSLYSPSCPNFIMCNGTNARPNRKPNSNVYMFNGINGCKCTYNTLK